MLIAVQREHDLSAAAAQVIEDVELRNQIRTQARQTAVDHDWNSVVNRTEGIFRSLIQNPSVLSAAITGQEVNIST